MMLYLVGMIRRDGETEGDEENSSRLWMFSAKRFMIAHLFLFFKVVVFNLFTLEHDSTAHNVGGVIHGIFLLDYNFEVSDFSVQPFQLPK